MHEIIECHISGETFAHLLTKQDVEQSTPVMLREHPATVEEKPKPSFAVARVRGQE
jgi:hypothetical protein